MDINSDAARQLDLEEKIKLISSATIPNDVMFRFPQAAYFPNRKDYNIRLHSHLTLRFWIFTVGEWALNKF
jgi:hypothetical protein